MKIILTGNEAIARGAYEAGVLNATAYPGTPSTEILENVVQYKEIHCQWSANEKVALEVGIGSSFAGARTLVAMKHVGVNVAADPLMTMTYTGVNGGLVLVAADDPGMHSSQNEQDSRHWARFGKLPCIEPSDSQECIDFLKEAYEISEKFDTPVLFRSTTRISHSETLVTLKERKESDKKIEFEQNAKKYVMIPAFARPRHIFIEERLKKLKEYAEKSKLNKIEINDDKIGIITSSVSYQYCKEVFPDASYLKLGITWPLAENKIKEFAKKVKKLYVIEELDPFLENEIKLLGVKVKGKPEKFLCNELNPEKVEEIITGKARKLNTPAEVPPRPPVLCAGCGHRFVFTVLNKLQCTVSGDIGCYTLGTLPPLNAMHTTVCMGAAIGVLEGILTVLPKEKRKKFVGVIGDSTFVHSGITGLVNIMYNLNDGLILILDNSITAMTGHQHHPATGKKLSGEPASILDFSALAHACGVGFVKKVSAWDYDQLYSTIQEGMDYEGLAVIIAKQDCILLDRNSYKKRYTVNEKCVHCGACVKVGCPAILTEYQDKKLVQVSIDQNLCVGCGLCAKMCKFGAIVEKEMK